jgi:hypothetical protein
LEQGSYHVQVTKGDESRPSQSFEVLNPIVVEHPATAPVYITEHVPIVWRDRTGYSGEYIVELGKDAYPDRAWFRLGTSRTPRFGWSVWRDYWPVGDRYWIRVCKPGFLDFCGVSHATGFSVETPVLRVTAPATAGGRPEIWRHDETRLIRWHWTAGPVRSTDKVNISLFHPGTTRGPAEYISIVRNVRADAGEYRWRVGSFGQDMTDPGEISGGRGAWATGTMGGAGALPDSDQWRIHIQLLLDAPYDRVDVSDMSEPFMIR